MKILSIVVPSYNTAEHVDRCAPHYLKVKRLKDIEILFINDGSVDDTVEKLSVYQAQCPDSIRIISKENGGHGSAVNTGIQEAQGTYFKVVDGDDWIEAENLDILIDALYHTDADVVLNPYYTDNQKTGKRKICSTVNFPEGEKISMENLPQGIFQISMHQWTLRTEILKKNGIRFTEHCYYDDFEYVTFPIPYIRTLLFQNNPVYHYLIGQAAQSVSDQSVFRNYMMSRKIISETIAFYYSHEGICAPRAKRYLLDTILNGVKQHYNIYLRNGREPLSYPRFLEFDDALKRYPDIYAQTGKKYPYILLARKLGKAGFLLDSALLRAYKHLS